MEKKRTVRVAVLGGANAGKSTMLNFFIGAKLLPSNCEIETASITYVTHDSNLQIGEFHCRDDASEVLFDSVNEANEWIRSKNRQEGIPVLYVSTNIRLTGTHTVPPQVGLELVDVPGMNEAGNELAKERIKQVLQVADMILVILKHEDIRTDVVETLGTMIREHGRDQAPVFLLVNKIDSIQERQDRERLQTSAETRYRTNTELFGERSIHVLCTQGERALNSLCHGEQCFQTGDCEVRHSLIGLIQFMDSSQQIRWFETLASWNADVRRREIHDEMVSTVREMSGVGPLRDKLLYLLVFSSVTTSLTTFVPPPEEREEMEKSWQPLANHCKRWGKTALFELVCKILHLREALAAKPELLCELPEDCEEAKADAEKQWEESIYTFLNGVLACRNSATTLLRKKACDTKLGLKRNLDDALTAVLRKVMGPRDTSWTSEGRRHTQHEALVVMLNARNEFDETMEMVSVLQDDLELDGHLRSILDKAMKLASKSWRISCEQFTVKEELEYKGKLDVAKCIGDIFVDAVSKKLLVKIPRTTSAAKAAIDVFVPAQTHDGKKEISLRKLGGLSVDAAKTLFGVFRAGIHFHTAEITLCKIIDESRAHDLKDRAIAELKRSFTATVKNEIDGILAKDPTSCTLEEVCALYFDRRWRFWNVVKMAAAAGVLGATVGGALVWYAGALASECAIVAGIGTGEGLLAGSLFRLWETGKMKGKCEEGAARDVEALMAGYLALSKLRSDAVRKNTDEIIEWVDKIEPFSKRFRLRYLG